MITKKINVSEIDAVVIPRSFTPPCTVKAIVEILTEVFGSASSSYILSDYPCEKSIIIDREYKQILENIQKKYKKKNYVYVTEMPFFIILHRVETADTLWYLMITNIMKLVKEGKFNSHTKVRSLMNEVVTIPYDMKKMKKSVNKKVK